jgi:hypothetical protein
MARAGFPRRGAAPGDRHRHRQQPEAGSLHRPAGDQHGERGRRRGKHRPRCDHRQCDQHGLALLRPVVEPARTGVTSAPASSAAVSSPCAAESET